MIAVYVSWEEPSARRIIQATVLALINGILALYLLSGSFSYGLGIFVELILVVGLFMSFAFIAAITYLAIFSWPELRGYFKHKDSP